MHSNSEVKEIWEYIPGYDKKYQINNYGIVKSFARLNPVFLKHNHDKRGYPTQTLTINGIVKTKKIHRLVAITFIKNPENKPEVNHKDGNKKNNFYKNLEWVTRNENEQHAHKTGLKTMKGDSQPRRKLNSGQVIEIRYLTALGKTKNELCKQFDVSKSCVTAILNRRQWSHI